MGELVSLTGSPSVREHEMRVCERDLESARQERQRARVRAGAIAENFVSGRLVVTAGPREGQPLSAKGRRQRLNKLLGLHEESIHLEYEMERLESQIEKLKLKQQLRGAWDEEDDWGA